MVTRERAQWSDGVQRERAGESGWDWGVHRFGGVESTAEGLVAGGGGPQRAGILGESAGRGGCLGGLSFFFCVGVDFRCSWEGRFFWSSFQTNTTCGE